MADCQMLYRSKTSSEDFDSVIDKIIELNQQFYKHNETSRKRLDNVFRNKDDSENIAGLLEVNNALIGYVFIRVITIQYEEKQIKLFQPMIDVLPEYAGKKIGLLAILKCFFHLLLKYKKDIYLTTFINSPNQYKQLATYFKGIYPSPTNLDQGSFNKTLLELLVKRWKLPVAVTHDNKVIMTKGNPVPLYQPLDPRSQSEYFFIKNNPDYQLGQSLGICQKITFKSTFEALRIACTLLIKKSYIGSLNKVQDNASERKRTNILKRFEHRKQ